MYDGDVKQEAKQMSKEREILLRTLREDAQSLEMIIRSYVVKMGLAHGDEAESTTREIMNETAVAALQAADSYDSGRRPIPWLLGIAIKRIQRAIAARKKSREREISIRDLYAEHEADASDDELFEHIALWVQQPNAFESEESLRSLLAPLSKPDRELIQKAVMQEMDAPSIAAELGISPSAVRVRLHRALKRLRAQMQLEELRYAKKA
jgi:RNA polymerase sigma factor (sigma-70 family)